MQQRMLGFEPAALVGTNMLALLHPDDVTLSMSGFQEVLGHVNPGTETPVRARCADGGWKVLGVVGVDFLQDPDIRGVVLNARDITEELEIKKALTHAARNDPLTNLPNRAYFETLFAQAQHKSLPHQQQALLFIDLDRFKWVNDSLGHPVGDRVLVRVAELLRITVTGVGQVGRLGGDEFCVSLTVKDAQAAQELAARIVDLLDQPLRDSGQAILLGASVGVALFPQHGKTYDELLRNADLAMFRAKSGGGGTVCMFSEDMAGEVQTRLQLATDLRVAIGAGQIDVAYQPQFDLHTGLLRGFEALARWTHAQHGPVPPDRFIPIAEQSGQIGLLGRLVMDKALIQARAWLAAGVPDLHLAVNVSAQQLRDSRFADEVAQRLHASGMDPRQFEVEITENTVVSASAQTKADLQRLRAIGVHIAIDDLGVGYSSLAYLKNLPVDVVKLDRSFISGLPHDRYDCALTSALTVLASTLNIELIAEGVETAEQAKYLAALGCRLGQGYYFSKPLPADEALRLVVRQRVAAAA
jgi:diguanylate cyclase (GGDEF)-like protein/PAS domain S-box-containing protein